VIQRFLPEVKHGDKRIIWSTANSPAPSTACRPPTICVPHGARRCRPSDRTSLRVEREICATLAPALRERGLLFVGIDVINGNSRDQR